MKIVNPKIGHGKGNMIDRTNFLDLSKPIKKNLLKSLPHWEQDGVLQFITLRLRDSLPDSKLDELREKLKNSEENALLYKDLEIINFYLTQGHGSCILKYAEIQDIVDKAINFYDGDRYELFDYVIMPNHIHILIIPYFPVEDIMLFLKRYTTTMINKYLKQRGGVWQDDYFDRMMRNYDDYSIVSSYIKGNPLGLKK